MKKYLTIFLTSFSLFLLLGVLRQPHTAKAQNDDHVPGQILVKFKPGTSEKEIKGQLEANRAHVVNKIEALGVLVLNVPETAEIRVLNALSHNPHVDYAESDGIATVLFTPNDPYFTSQWGLENPNDADIDATSAWDKTQGSGVVVAILDTGVAKNHPDVSAKVVGRANFSDAPTDDDVYGHATHVGGIVAGVTNNGKGIAGGCPGCNLLSGKVLNDSGSGAYSWVASGVTWAVQNGAKVINLSLGGSARSRTLENAVNYAWYNNVVVVAAAGNAGNQSKSYPAAYTNAIAVAATDNQDHKAYFSEYGNWVDVAAPGVDIFSTWNDSSSASNPQPTCESTFECYKYASGTSMATPMTAAVAALIWSTPYGGSAASVRSRLEATADKIAGTGTYWSGGRVNAANAVN